MTEIFLDIPGYEGLYKISNLGNVYSVKRMRLIKPRLSSSGYYDIGLYKDCRHSRRFIHRLVADVFVVKHESCDYVRHKDGDKTNNESSNLEWVTYKEIRNI